MSKNITKSIPYVPEEIVKYLLKTFPNELPTGEYDLRDVDIAVGEQRVIRHLATVSSRQDASESLAKHVLRRHP